LSVFYLRTQWFCGKCAEDNGGGCAAICPGKSAKTAIMVAGLRVDMCPTPPEHEAGVAMFDIKLCDSYWDFLT
jgi:hypothetical protein